jgi:hypothetical protein
LSIGIALAEPARASTATVLRMERMVRIWGTPWGVGDA